MSYLYLCAHHVLVFTQAFVRCTPPNNSGPIVTCIIGVVCTLLHVPFKHILLPCAANCNISRIPRTSPHHAARTILNTR